LKIPIPETNAMLKLSFSTLGCPDWTLREIAENAARMGYHAVDFRGLLKAVDVTGLPEFTTGLAETRRLLEDAGVAISGFAASTRCAVADPAEWAKQFDEARRNMELAQAFGAGVVRVFGGAIPKEHTMESIWPHLVSNLRALGDAAEQFGVLAALETHDAWTDSALFARLMREVNHPRVRVLWDLCNPYFEKRESPETTHALLAPYVVSTHVKDAVEIGPGKHDYRFLGEGEVPVRRMLELLVQGGYRGYAVLEWEKRWRPALPAPEQAFPQFVAKMRDWRLAAP